MKYFLLHVCLILCLPTVCSVKAQVKTGPVLDDFGPVYPIEDADLLPDSDRLYKVIFDVYTDERKSDRMNPLIHTVARFLNMHGQYGVAEENMKLVLVLHGTATKNALSDDAYKKMAKKSNPNTALLKALSDKGVKIYVCGQSMKSKGFEARDLSEHVRVSLSAMTALVKYQSEGYALINFN